MTWATPIPRLFLQQLSVDVPTQVNLPPILRSSCGSLSPIVGTDISGTSLLWTPLGQQKVS